MSYKVQYTPQDDYRYPLIKQHGRRNRGGVWGFLLLILLVLLIVYNGVPDFVFPGNPQITRAAVKEMVTNMENGTAVKDAIYVFCKQIIEGAGV